MHRLIAAALTATACAQGAQAQTSPPAAVGSTLTLEHAFELAGTTVPRVEGASAGVRAAEAQRRAADLRPNPSVDVGTEIIIGTGTYSGLSSAEAAVGMSLPLELGGNRSARIGVADAQVARADPALWATRAFNDAVAGERRLAIARGQVGIAEEGLRVARVRVRAGKASPIEEQRAEVSRANAGNATNRAGRAMALTGGNLGRLIGREAEQCRLAGDEEGSVSIAAPPTCSRATSRLTRGRSTTWP